MARQTAQPDARELTGLERRASELDRLAATAPATAQAAGTVAAARRFLLLELERLGLLGSDPPDPGPGRPVLRGYRDAAADLRAYLTSDERRGLFPGASEGTPRVLGAAVSLDWFRHPQPLTAGGEAPLAWLARCERTLLAAPIADIDGAGEIFVPDAGGGWRSVGWRRDDGVTPALVGGEPAA